MSVGSAVAGGRSVSPLSLAWQQAAPCAWGLCVVWPSILVVGCISAGAAPCALVHDAAPCNMVLMLKGVFSHDGSSVTVQHGQAALQMHQAQALQHQNRNSLHCCCSCCFDQFSARPAVHNLVPLHADVHGQPASALARAEQSVAQGTSVKSSACRYPYSTTNNIYLMTWMVVWMSNAHELCNRETRLPWTRHLHCEIVRRAIVHCAKTGADTRKSDMH
jgi:hypothetical protein